MRTEDKERSMIALADVYQNLVHLANITNDTRFTYQAEGIRLAATTLGLLDLPRILELMNREHRTHHVD